MLETLKRLTISQFEASLCTLAHCVAGCPDELWNAPVAKFPFNLVAFHTLFFADYYLEPSPDSFRQQPFHRANAQLFGDYEHLDDREPVVLYDKPQIEMYLDFLRNKAVATISGETEAELCAPAKFPRRNISRAELHIYNMRHIQHHAAQLILRLRLDSKVDIPWIGAGWREPIAHGAG